MARRVLAGRRVRHRADIYDRRQVKYKKKCATRGCFASFRSRGGDDTGGRRTAWSGRRRGRQGEGHGSERDGMRNVRRRQYLRVRRPANIHACVSKNLASRTVPRRIRNVSRNTYAFERDVHVIAGLSTQLSILSEDKRSIFRACGSRLAFVHVQFRISRGSLNAASP